MQISKPAVSIELDKRRIKNDQTYPVKLRITYQRNQKYYALGINLTEVDFNIIISGQMNTLKRSTQRKDEMKKHRLKLDSIQLKAYEVIQSLPKFSLRLFEEKMFQPKVKNTTVYSVFEEMIDKLRQENRFGTASSYQCALNALIRFKSHLEFNQVTPKFLQEFEHWFTQDGGSISTVGIYLRPLRAVLNIAIEDGLMDKSDYPFGKRRYVIPASRNVKKALNLEEIRKIYDYEAMPGTWWQKAKDLWLFSYFAGGMNMKDISCLTRDNLDGNHLIFHRSKTARTNKASMQPIVLPLSEDLRRIIDTWQQPESKYIFPILSDDMDMEKERMAIQQCVKMVNHYIRMIAKEVGIDKNITTYYARHSFATVLKRSGVSTEFISEALGHSNITTTKTYLDSFDVESKAEVLKLLKVFKN